MDRQQNKVERFLKLGYTYADIQRVLESLHDDAQTNDILEELIKTCRRNTGSASTSPLVQRGPSPQLIPRSCTPTKTQQVSTEDREASGGLRPIVIDGSNVAMSHGNKLVFSCRGVQLAVKWFWDRGHRDITVFVPLWRKEQPRPEAPITEQHILHELEKRKIVVFTPSRCVNGKRVVCYDDRYIVKLAYDSDGVIVSNDNYRDLQIEKPQWKKFIEERLLMYTFANDMFMPPDDPLGRNGPTIDDFLKKKPKGLESKRLHCPYGKKCTFGIKCKFYHPERVNQPLLSVADELRATAAERDNPSGPQSSISSQKSPSSTYTSNAEIPDGGPSSLLQLHSISSTSYEDIRSRLSPNKHLDSPRETGSPVHLRKSPSCLSMDSDEAFVSLENSLSQLYIQEPAHTSRTSNPYSNFSSQSNNSNSDCFHFLNLSRTESQGVDGHPGGPCNCSHARPDGSYDYKHRPEPIAFASLQYRQQYKQRCFNHQAKTHTTDQHYHHSHFREHPNPPHYPREHSPTGTGECRRNIQTQLSTIFPQTVVEQAMRLYPQSLDMAELVPLIHQLRSNQMNFYPK